MWLLECTGKDFDGKRLWLRPGKKYLFGRTGSESSASIVISHKTISRKHLIIAVGPVHEGESGMPAKRSEVTIEDCKTKSGTLVNGKTIKGETFAVRDDVTTLKLGLYDVDFHLRWHPVVISTSFNHKDLQAGALARLRHRFEQLDVKLINEYRATEVTHVVSKKRNTPKGLQALINGHYIITAGFLEAIASAAGRLEEDYDGAWPDELLYLPPKGNEKSDRPDSEYRPDGARQDIFDGYTFVFYDQTQCDNVRAAITTGKGKALAYHVTPGDTAIDDFIRYAKSVAGEKGLGSFEDGSEGKGVVVVRHTASKGDADSDWFKMFFETISLRLDHRPIDQAEFIDAILRKEPGMLRRPLQSESPPREQMQPAQPAGVPLSQAMDVDVPAATQSSAQESAQPGAQESAQSSAQDTAQLPVRRGRTRQPIKKRFAGFVSDDVDVDEDVGVSVNSNPNATTAGESFENTAPAPPPPPTDSQGLFVTQEREERASGPSQTKRTASPFDEPDLMDSIAPTAAARKRQRLEAGEDARPRDPSSAEPTPVPAQPTERAADEHTLEQNANGPVDVVEFLRKKNQEDEARQRAERQAMADVANSGVDLAAIRNLAIVEDMVPVRRRDRAAAAAPGQEDQESRWDPRWNGRKNFKKFRRRGEAQGRAPMRTIVQLMQAKAQTFGIGDEYWLEEEERATRPAGKPNKRNTGTSTTGGRPQRGVMGDDVAMEASPPVATTRGRARGRHQQPQPEEPQAELVVESDAEPEPTPAQDTGVVDASAEPVPEPEPEPEPDLEPSPAPPIQSQHAARTRTATATATRLDTQSVAAAMQTPSSRVDTQSAQPSTSTRSMGAGSKRPTSTRENLQQEPEPAAKRVRKPSPPRPAEPEPPAIKESEDDDDGDDDGDVNMKFKFKKR